MCAINGKQQQTIDIDSIDKLQHLSTASCIFQTAQVSASVVLLDVAVYQTVVASSRVRNTDPVLYRMVFLSTLLTTRQDHT